MRTTLTAKLKLTTSPEQFQVLRTTQLAYRDALNLVSAYAFAHGKTSNQQRLQRETYAQVRSRFGLPAQMACNVPRQVGATYKTLWTKVKKNAEARRRGFTKKRYKGLDQPPHYVSPTLTYNYHRDFSLKGDQQVSILTLGGRIVIPYTGYSKHMALLHHLATIGAAKLWYDRAKKRFYLLVSVVVETPEPTPESCQQIIGVDVGQRYLATVATTTNEAQFYSGKQVRATTDHYARLQKRLQRKGTRSATRKLVQLAGRERRLKLDTNHCISRRIIATHPNSVIGLEDLNGIRERTRRKHGKKATRKQRKANRHASRWAFAELRSFLAYKAALAESVCITVDADYTSQSCPRCGWICRKNRLDHGLLFVCQACQYTLHADLVGARNIALRTWCIRHAWVYTGHLSVAPDDASCEAKAARLSRYAELRWSSASSSPPLGGE
ncbi:MAG: RNA-guided endonuclease InsQ/TnpB family protein [Ktedonobacterales bacterium]